VARNVDDLLAVAGKESVLINREAQNAGSLESRIFVDTITTTFRRQWFSQIVGRKKRIEYRGIKPYWTLRLKRVKTPFRSVLRNVCYKK